MPKFSKRVLFIALAAVIVVSVGAYWSTSLFKQSGGKGKSKGKSKVSFNPKLKSCIKINKKLKKINEQLNNLGEDNDRHEKEITRYKREQHTSNAHLTKDLNIKIDNNNKKIEKLGTIAQGLYNKQVICKNSGF